MKGEPMSDMLPPPAPAAERQDDGPAESGYVKLRNEILAGGASDEPGADDTVGGRRAATGLFEPRRNISAPLETEELLLRAGDRRDWRNHLRSWRAFLSEFSVMRRAALAASLGGRMVSEYPLDIVRREGIRLLDQRLANGPGAPVRGAKGGFPHRGGTWDSAAGEVCGIWKRLVFGRTE